MTDILDDLARRSAMHGPMWDEIAAVPRRRDWSELRSEFASAIWDNFTRWIGPDQSHYRDQLIFALGRFDEGAGLVRYFERYEPRLPKDRPIRVLDIGAGNGGVAIALANCARYSVYTLDIVPNADLATLRRRLGVPVRQAVGFGDAAPFAGDSFDVILLLDTIEHVARRQSLAAEIMRTLRPGGMCMITTPARLRHLFGPDPHYGIRGLVMFPNAMQRLIVNRLFRRRIYGERGTSWPAYDVEHIFWHYREVARLFPGARTVEVLFNRPPDQNAPRFTKEWYRYRLRGFLWDRIVIYKS